MLPAQFPVGSGNETSTELYVNPASFRQVFASDLPEQQAAVLGASQRPIAASVFAEKLASRPRAAVVGRRRHRQQGRRR